MFINNWYAILSGFCLASDDSTSVTLRPINAQSSRGYGMSIAEIKRRFTTTTNPTAMVGILAGSGDGDITIDTYDFDVVNLTEISSSQSVLTEGVKDRERFMTTTAVFENKTSETVIVNELLLCIWDYNQWVTDLREAAYVLAREKFNSPISISPGEVRSFTMTIGM